ncbi:MAG TPA: alpha/beta fold hydrolase [Acidimicrobiales bacterium]|jgi:3-oxoadipate enol-lactonase|nr:alpha/beta fold hydrolase [Acidimicrobiales bacterium]
MSTVDRGDAQVWWDEEGEGEPVLLIMGLGYPSDMWFRIWPELATRYRVIRFDNRGTGRTGVPPGPYTVELMADDAIAVLDAAGVERAHVIGASMGGLIAQQVVATHPERVASLGLVCTGAGGEHMAPADPEALAMMAARATMPPEEAAEVAIPFVYASTTPRSRIDEDFEVRLRVPTPPEGYANQLMGVSGWQGVWDALATISVPTLVLSGKADRLVNPENATILAERIPGAQLVLLDDASHVLMTDQPEETTKHLLAFLDAVR